MLNLYLQKPLNKVVKIPFSYLFIQLAENARTNALMKHIKRSNGRKSIELNSSCKKGNFYFGLDFVKEDSLKKPQKVIEQPTNSNAKMDQPKIL